MKRLQIVSIAFTGVAAIMAIIATIIDHWVHFTYTNFDEIVRGYAGLWESCRVTDSKKQCSLLEIQDIAGLHGDYAAIQACRTLMVIGLVLMAVTILLMFMKVTSRVVAPICMVVGGVCIATAVIVYGAKFYRDARDARERDDPQLRDTVTLHAGFGLAIVAAVFSFIAGGTMWVTARQTGYTQF